MDERGGGEASDTTWLGSEIQVHMPEICLSGSQSLNCFHCLVNSIPVAHRERNVNILFSV